MRNERNIKIATNGAYTTAVEIGHAVDGLALIAVRYPWIDVDWMMAQDWLYGEDRLVARVKCHEADPYDAETGRREAVRKLNRTIVKQREMIVERFEAYMRKQMAHPASKKKLVLNEE